MFSSHAFVHIFATTYNTTYYQFATTKNVLKVNISGQKRNKIVYITKGSSVKFRPLTKQPKM